MAEDASHANGQVADPSSEPGSPAPSTALPTTSSEPKQPASLEEARALHATGEIDNDAFRRLQNTLPAEAPESEEAPATAQPPDTEQPPATLAKLSKDDLLAQLGELGDALTHDDLKNVPAYNKRLMQTIQQSKAEQANAAAMGEWSDFFEKLSPEQLVSLQKDDSLAGQVTNGNMTAAGIRQMFDAVQAWKVSGQARRNPSYKMASEDIRQEIEDTLMAMDAYPAIAKNIKQIKEFSGDSGAKLFARAIEVALEDGIRTGLAKIKAESEAKLNEARAQFHLTNGNGQPDIQSGGSTAVNGQHAFTTLEEARAAHATGDITNDQMRQALVLFG